MTNTSYYNIWVIKLIYLQSYPWVLVDLFVQIGQYLPEVIEQSQSNWKKIQVCLEKTKTLNW